MRDEKTFDARETICRIVYLPRGALRQHRPRPIQQAEEESEQSSDEEADEPDQTEKIISIYCG